MIKKLFTTVAVAALLAVSASATQLPYPSVSSNIDTQLPTNQTGLISAPALRGVLHNMLDSVPVTGALYPATNAGSSYTYQTLDQASSYTFTAASPAITLQKPVALATTATQIAKGWWATISAGPSSSVTITPTGSTISANGAAPASSQTLAPSTSAIVSTDGVNYFSTVISPGSGGGGGTGSVAAGVAPQFGYYASSGTTISGMSLTDSLLGPNLGNVVAYGASPGATAAVNTAAFNNASAAGTYLYIPPGKFNLNQLATITIANRSGYTVRGAGRGVTTLDFVTGANAFVFSWGGLYSGLTFTDMTIETGQTNVGIGVDLLSAIANVAPGSNPQNYIGHVDFYGDDGIGQTHTWADCIVVSGVSNVVIDDVNMIGSAAAPSGVGIRLTGVPSLPAYSVEDNIVNTSSLWQGVSVIYGTFVQGVTLSGFNSTGSGTGVIVPAGVTQVAQLAVVNSQFQDTSVAFSILSEIESAQISNSFFLVEKNSTTAVTGVPNYFTFSNNYVRCDGTADIGVVMNSGALGGTLTGNVYRNCGVGNQFNSGATQFNVQSNRYVNIATQNLNLGGGTNTIGGGSQ